MPNKQKSLKCCMTNLRKENTILGMGSYTKPFHYKKVLGKFCSLNLAKSLSPNPFKRL